MANVGGKSETAAALMMAERPQLLNLAYRMLGNLSDAEDAVQDAFARWYAMTAEQQEAIASPGAWLSTVASRICLDLLGSARVRRETYAGQWLPEPVPEPAHGDDPADRLTLDESISMAFLVVLDAMTPAERVAFILHDVYGYPFADIAGIVGRTPAACRQLAVSARRRVRTARTPTPSTDRGHLVAEFRRAWLAQDVEALVTLLDPRVTAVGDGGGLATAAPEPVVGAHQVAEALVDITSREAGLTMDLRTVNGEPGIVVVQHGAVIAVLALGVGNGRITQIWAVRNPEKLTNWAL